MKKMIENNFNYEVINYDEIIYIHIGVIIEGGGQHGLMSDGNLDYIVQHIRVHKYPGDRKEKIISKAAYLLYNLIVLHPFTDGNKRTAHLTTIIFLSQNGLFLHRGEEEIIEFLKTIAQLEISQKEVRKWLKNHVKNHR